MRISVDKLVTSLYPGQVVALSRWTSAECDAMDKGCTCMAGELPQNRCCGRGAKQIVRCAGRMTVWAELIEKKREAIRAELKAMVRTLRTTLRAKEREGRS